MGKPERWRCLTVGCNPTLVQTTAVAHREKTGHRVAKWPVRSAEGKRRAKIRNRTGYYDWYNVGEKSAVVRGLRPDGPWRDPYETDHPMSSEGLGQW